MSSNLNSILSEESRLIEITRAIFAHVNTNKSGKIDRRELKAYMLQFAIENECQNPSEREVDEALQNFDMDESGNLDINEFKEFIRDLLIRMRG